MNAKTSTISGQAWPSRVRSKTPNAALLIWFHVLRLLFSFSSRRTKQMAFILLATAVHADCFLLLSLRNPHRAFAQLSNPVVSTADRSVCANFKENSEPDRLLGADPKLEPGEDSSSVQFSGIGAASQSSVSLWCYFLFKCQLCFDVLGDC